MIFKWEIGGRKYCGFRIGMTREGTRDMTTHDTLGTVGANQIARPYLKAYPTIHKRGFHKRPLVNNVFDLTAIIDLNTCSAKFCSRCRSQMSLLALHSIGVVCVRL